MIIEGPAFIGFGYRESTPLSDVDETIIWEAELDTLTLGGDLFGIYDKSRLSSKKRKCDIDICGYNPSVSAAWKKNIVDFFSRVATTVNESF